MYLLLFLISAFINTLLASDITVLNTKDRTICDNLCVCYENIRSLNHFPYIIVDCSLCSLTSFDFNESIPLLIRSLDLSRNHITKLEGNYKIFKSKTILTLDLSRNRIVSIEDGFFEGLSNLVKLDLSENMFLYITPAAFYGLEQLQELDLSFNKLKMLPNKMFAGLKNLKILSLSYNPIGRFLSENENLFTHNGLDLTIHLKVLRLENISLPKLSRSLIENAKNLVELYVSENPLTELPIMPHNLEILDISGTKITKLSSEVLACPKLKILMINRAYNLTKIESYAFYNLDQIEVISLENCVALDSFNDMAFGIEKISETYPDHTLKKLSLARSGLTSLNKTLIHFFKRISVLELDGNPWICDCRLEWIRELKININSPYLRCNAPSDLQFIPFKNVTKPSCDIDKSVSLLTIIFIVIFFIILIVISLIYYNGPWSSDGKLSAIGRIAPTSPYNQITIEPNSAEQIN